MDDHATIHHAFLKGVSAVGVFMTIDLWTTAGKIAAAAYSMIVLCEWVWKRIVKPLAHRLGRTKTPNVIIRSEDL